MSKIKLTESDIAMLDAIIAMKKEEKEITLLFVIKEKTFRINVN